MKSRLIQLSKGNIEYRVPEVRFGVEKLSGLLLPDRKAAFEVTVNSENNVPMHLFFYSQDARIRVSQPLSIGRTGKFTVEINTFGLVPNDRIRGNIDIVYNGGETSLPYDFMIGVLCGDRVQKSFDSLTEFAEFAAKNPKEAAALFCFRDFTSMPFMQDLRLRGLYGTFQIQFCPHDVLNLRRDSCRPDPDYTDQRQYQSEVLPDCCPDLRRHLHSLDPVDFLRHLGKTEGTGQSSAQRQFCAVLHSV